MLESFQMGSFHTIVLVVAFVILLVILMVVGFGIKNTSKAVPFPPVPSSCPNEWVPATPDLSGNPICTLSDPSFNMPQIIAVGSKFVFSANGDQWKTITGDPSSYNGLADISANNWIITKTDSVYYASSNNTGVFSIGEIIDTGINNISGVVATNNNECYVYGGITITSKPAIRKITYNGSAFTASGSNPEYLYIPKGADTFSGSILAHNSGTSTLRITTTSGTIDDKDAFFIDNVRYIITKTGSDDNPTYTVPSALTSDKPIPSGTQVYQKPSGTVIGLAYKPTSGTNGLFLAIVQSDASKYTLYSSNLTATGFEPWKSRGDTSKTTTKFTPKCITYADNRFFMGGETNEESDADKKNVICSTAGNMPTGDLSWTPRAKSTDISGDVVGIIYTDNKRFIAISNQAAATIGSDAEKATADAAATTIISSTNGSTWTSVAKGDKFIGGKAIGFRKNTTADKGLNVGSGFIKSVGNVKWDDAYSIKLGTSTICEQRNWANGNRQITWDGVSNYNSC